MSEQITFEELDSTNLRGFLDSPTGQKLIPYLLSQRPSISAKEHLTSANPMAAAALSGYIAAGWEDCLDRIQSLSNGSRGAFKGL